MLRAGTKGPNPLILIGLSEGNVMRLKNGFPICAPLSDFSPGMTGDMTIIYGKTEADIQQPADFLLFHHFSDFEQLQRFPHPKAFWLFDLVSCPDATLHARNRAREDWLRRATEVATVGFLTDGDAVNRAGRLGGCRLLAGAGLAG